MELPNTQIFCTSTWKIARSMLPTLMAAGKIWNHPHGTSGRSVCCNGSLYLCDVTGFEDILYVLKVDIQMDQWHMIPMDLSLKCGDYTLWQSQILSFDGAILLWHPHVPNYRPVSKKKAECLKRELFDPKHARYPQCSYDVKPGGDPEIKLAPYKGTEKTDGFCYMHRTWLTLL